MQVPHFESNVGAAERDAVARVIESGWITEGKEAAAFVAELQALTGAPYAVLAPNGTLALAMALLALNVGPGDEVIVPASTFIGSATAVTLAGATPVFCEVDPVHYQMTVSDADRARTFRTRAIMPVHLYGAVCAMEELLPYAQHHGLHVVEDAAQAIGITRNGQHAGTFGVIAGMSFFADKSVTTGEGGLVMTTDPQLYQRLREIRNQGRRDRGYYVHPTIGYNFRMTDLQAAMGRVQLARLPDTKQEKLRVFAGYQRRLEGLPVTLLVADPVTSFIPHRIVAQFDDARQAEVFLRARGVEARTTYMPMPYQPCFAHLPSASLPFPNAQALYDRGLMLPSYPTMSEQAVAYVCAQIRAYCEDAAST